MKYTILGGDKRSLELGNLLMKDGNDLCFYGFDKLDQSKYPLIDLKEAIGFADVIVAPLPFTEDNMNINSPFSSEKIKIDYVFSLISKDQLILGGKYGDLHENKLKTMNLKFDDYFKREELQVLNAIPTAEGAIQVAMEELSTTLHGSNVLVLGYGRIGKALSQMLDGIGSNVYVEARNYTDLAWIKNYGYKGIHQKYLKDYLPKMDLIFNTIPKLILDKELLGSVERSCIIIDLASKPGGVDLVTAEELGLKAVTALGLPGKVAPVTAAMVIKDTIYNIIEELSI